MIYKSFPAILLYVYFLAPESLSYKFKIERVSSRASRLSRVGTCIFSRFYLFQDSDSLLRVFSRAFRSSIMRACIFSRLLKNHGKAIRPRVFSRGGSYSQSVDKFQLFTGIFSRALRVSSRGFACNFSQTCVYLLAIYLVFDSL